MKKTIFILLVFAIFAMAFTFSTNKGTDDLEMSEDVKSIVDDKCYGCHSPEGKSDKAKEKLMWNELSHLSRIKLIGKLDDISEVMEKGEMPPEKFLEKFPNKKLTEEESKKIKEWAVSAANKVLE